MSSSISKSLSSLSLPRKKKKGESYISYNVYDEEDSNNILAYLNLLDFEDGQLFFSNNKKLTSNPIPAFLMPLKEDLERKMKTYYNSVEIIKNDGSNNKLFLADNKGPLTKILSVVFFGDVDEIYSEDLSSNESRSSEIGNNTVFTINEFNIYKKEFFTVKEGKVGYAIIFKNKSVIRNQQLLYIYQNTDRRVEFMKKIEQQLSVIFRTPGSHCVLKGGVNYLWKNLHLVEIIGIGNWGNLYSTCLTQDCDEGENIAVKLSKINQDAVGVNPRFHQQWLEILVMRDIIRPIIENKICPNLPLYMTHFFCDSCDFTFKRKGRESHPCQILVTELAQGNMKEYLLENNPSLGELYSALFQIMAGLHAIHKYAQLYHRDVKATNILFYNVDPGGYWEYVIDGISYYVPNYGKIFILNDFGVSFIFNPDYMIYDRPESTHFSLGSRFAIVDGKKFSPIISTYKVKGSGEIKDVISNKGSKSLSRSLWKKENIKLKKTKRIVWETDGKNKNREYSFGSKYKFNKKGFVEDAGTNLTRDQKLLMKGYSPTSLDFFRDSMLLPPFEFYNDVQDVLKIFTGGRRSTQGDYVTRYASVPQEMVNLLKMYAGPVNSYSNRKFHLYKTYHVLAKDFIHKFFKETINYTIKPEGKKIETFRM